MEKKVYRPRLNEWEIRTFWRLVDDEYRRMRRNIRYSRQRLKRGGRDSLFYPLPEQERHLEMFKRLLKKLNRLRKGKYGINV